MRLDITSLTYEPQWHEFGDCELLIRPYPASRANFEITGDTLVISGGNLCEVFKHCLVDWKNVVGSDGTPLPCTDEVKQKVYDFRLAGIAEFVLRKARQFADRKASAEKNSSSGRGGPSQKAA